MGNEIAKKESKLNPSSNSVFVNSPFISTSPTLLAQCTSVTNKISIIDLETNQNYVTFDGARISDNTYSWTYVKEIPNTKLLVSLHHNYEKSANMQIFNISKKGKVDKVYSLGEVCGNVGPGDVSYNSRRGILSAIPVTGRIAYHLFRVDFHASNAQEIVKLSRKTKWYSSNSIQPRYCADGSISGFNCFDFNPAGDSIATLNRLGACLISDVDTNNHVFHLQVGLQDDRWSRCRWSTNIGEPSLFVKYNEKELNILDVEKKALILSNPVLLDTTTDFVGPQTYWIDALENNGNLLASGGTEKAVKIFDKRESKIVKTFKRVHSKSIFSVRWNPNGDMLASASEDEKIKVLDFKTGKVLYTGTTLGETPDSVCFI